MQASNDTALARRPESLVGICAAIGEDFGFNPDVLRVPLAVGLLFSPAAVLIAYLGMGVAVLASRLLFPKRARGPRLAAMSAGCPETNGADVGDAFVEPLREAA